MRSRQLQVALVEFVEAAAAQLGGDVRAGAEVAFELDSRGGRGGSRAGALYCYRALTGEFIAERLAAPERLPSHAQAAAALGGFEGLERYLRSVGIDPGRTGTQARVRGAIKALLDDVFSEQSDFAVRPERLQAALERLEQSAFASAEAVTLVATLHGLAITSPELALTKGLTIAQLHALEGLPDGARAGGESGAGEHLVVVLATEDADLGVAARRGRELLEELLRALRLFGDGRVTLGELAWARIGTGAWSPLALGAGGRPRGMLVVTAEQEDELRAFCNLVARRAPHSNELAWALRRFELGCERDSAFEALSDNLLALRALLEPEGPASGLLAGRLAALCATPEHRLALTERTIEALALERAVVAGTVVEHAGAITLAAETGEHLRALLRDVICGHLDANLASLADEILLAPADEILLAPAEEILLAPEQPGGPALEQIGAEHLASAEQVAGDPRQTEEILDVFI